MNCTSLFSLRWLLALGLGFMLTLAAPAEDPPAPIEASDLQKLTAIQGQKAIVHGTVREVEVMKSMHQKVRFSGSPFVLYLHKNDIALNPGWDPAALKGKEIFAAGEVSKYRDQWELLVRSPKHIAETADKIEFSTVTVKAAPGGKATPGPNGAPGKEPGSPESGGGPQPKRDLVTFKQIVADFEGPTPILRTETIEASFVPGSRSAQTVLRIDPFSSKARDAVIPVVEIFKAAHGGFPPGKNISFRRVQGGTGACQPSLFGALVAMEALMENVELPDSLYLGGTANNSGSLAGGATEVGLLPVSRLGDGVVILLPDRAEAGIRDLALDGRYDVLLKVDVFGAKDAAAGLAFIRRWNSPESQPAQKALAEIRTALARTPAAELVKSGAFRAKLELVQKTAPEHLASRVILAPESREAQLTYSSSGSGTRIRQFCADAKPTLSGLKSHLDDADTKKKVRDLETRFEQLEPRMHPDWKRFADAAKAWLEASKDFLRYGRDKGSPKGKKAADALTETAKAVESEMITAAKMVDTGS